jgi:putative FmdB family regulatory protein
MPTWDYICENCGDQTEITKSVQGIDDIEYCEKCGSGLTRQFSFSATTPTSWFRPGFDDGLDKYVESKDHRKRLMKEMKLEEAG